MPLLPLANNMPGASQDPSLPRTPIDYIAADRAQLFKDDSPLCCLILTHGFALHHLCTTYSSIPNFIAKVRLSIIDEGQQGGQAGFTALAASLPRSCLQIFTGDKEQTRAGTGGDPLKEALLSRLAQKAIGFLGGPNPRLSAEMLSTFAAALRADTTLKPLLPTDPAPTPSPSQSPSLPPLYGKLKA